MKIIQRLLLVIGIIVVGVVSMYVWFGIQARAKIGKMMEFVIPTGPVTDGVVTYLDGHSNVYLIKSDTGYVAIDGGDSVAGTIEGLEELGIGQQEVKAVLLTHSDTDHTGGISVFEDAKAFLSSEEAKVVNGEYRRTFSKTRISFPNSNVVAHDFETVEDGEMIVIDGLEIECFLTPGHTKGSMSFLVNEKWLFTGDTIAAENGVGTIFVSLFNQNDKENESSITKLAQMIKDRDLEWVFTAHYGCYDDIERFFLNW